MKFSLDFIESIQITKIFLPTKIIKMSSCDFLLCKIFFIYYRVEWISLGIIIWKESRNLLSLWKILTRDLFSFHPDVDIFIHLQMISMHSEDDYGGDGSIY